MCDKKTTQNPKVSRKKSCQQYQEKNLRYKNTYFESHCNVGVPRLSSSSADLHTNRQIKRYRLEHTLLIDYKLAPLRIDLCHWLQHKIHISWLVVDFSSLCCYPCMNLPVSSFSTLSLSKWQKIPAISMKNSSPNESIKINNNATKYSKKRDS